MKDPRHTPYPVLVFATEFWSDDRAAQQRFWLLLDTSEWYGEHGPA